MDQLARREVADLVLARGEVLENSPLKTRVLLLLLMLLEVLRMLLLLVYSWNTFISMYNNPPINHVELSEISER